MNANGASCNAIRYGTEARAQRILDRAEADPGWRYVLQACADCGGWHVVQEQVMRASDWPLESRAAMCYRKTRYYTEATAWQVCTRRSTPEQPLRVYTCPCCGWFHLTSQPMKG